MRWFVVLGLCGCVGCSTAPQTPIIEYRYRAIPQELIPQPPILESIQGGELPKQCVSDETYRKIVTNIYALKNYSSQLRILVETNTE